MAGVTGVVCVAAAAASLGLVHILAVDDEPHEGYLAKPMSVHTGS